MNSNQPNATCASCYERFGWQLATGSDGGNTVQRCSKCNDAVNDRGGCIECDNPTGMTDKGFLKCKKCGVGYYLNPDTGAGLAQCLSCQDSNSGADKVVGC